MGAPCEVLKHRCGDGCALRRVGATAHLQGEEEEERKKAGGGRGRKWRSNKEPADEVGESIDQPAGPFILRFIHLVA